MKSLVGKAVVIVAEGFGKVKGVVLANQTDRVIVSGEDGQPVTIIKSAVRGWKRAGDGFQPVHLLGCSNPTIKCPGVRYFKSGNDVTGAFQTFMKPCPKCQSSCRRTDEGDIASVSRDVLASLLDDTIYGDYPEGEAE